MIDKLMLDKIINNALAEDIGIGDITTACTVPEEAVIEGSFIAKEAGVLCGLFVMERVFSIIDMRVKVKILAQEGTFVEKGTVFAEIDGPARSILSGERVALNLLQRMSGIATSTRKYVNEIKGTRARITDTRKTTPGLRVLEKYAVKVGGGSNHRFNLSDGVLIKDNHIAAAGGIKQAVERARENIPHTLKIEVEVENFEQLNEALEVKADIIMLDNMTNEDMKKAVSIVNKRALIEASGNMGDKDLREVANTGVDIISIGALTHTVKSMDISLKFVKRTYEGNRIKI